MTKRPKRKKSTVGGYAVPPPERAQHDALEVKSIDPLNPAVRRVQVRTPNRLAKYRALGSITEAQYQAGEALAALWVRAGLQQRVTANWSGAGGGGHVDLTAGQLDARQALLRALSGSRLGHNELLISVCCYDQTARTFRLRQALQLLAVHFGLVRA